jgi:hypothetical protein
VLERRENHRHRSRAQELIYANCGGSDCDEFVITASPAARRLIYSYANDQTIICSHKNLLCRNGHSQSQVFD